MTSLQIQYFLKVADCMSFSRAAEALYISQPSVSRQVKLLEEELGCALFDRTQKSRIRLTAAGMIFRESFRRAADDLDKAKKTASHLAAHDALRLRVGIGTGWDLSDALIRFRTQVIAAYPQAELSFECCDFRTLRERLRAGELDVILCTKTSLLDFDGLGLTQVADLDSRAYVRRGLLRPENEPLRIEDFSGRRLLMLREEESPMAMELVRIIFQARQIKVDPVWLPNRETILQAVLMGEGFTVFDQHIYFRDDPRLTYCRLEDVIPICAVWNKERENPLIPLFAEEIARAMNAFGAGSQHAQDCFPNTLL